MSLEGTAALGYPSPSSAEPGAHRRKEASPFSRDLQTCPHHTHRPVPKSVRCRWKAWSLPLIVHYFLFFFKLGIILPLFSPLSCGGSVLCDQAMHIRETRRTKTHRALLGLWYSAVIPRVLIGKVCQVWVFRDGDVRGQSCEHFSQGPTTSSWWKLKSLEL